jgi:hypothetical protein
MGWIRIPDCCGYFEQALFSVDKELARSFQADFIQDLRICHAEFREPTLQCTYGDVFQIGGVLN